MCGRDRDLRSGGECSRPYQQQGSHRIYVCDSDFYLPEEEQGSRVDFSIPMVVDNFLRDFKKTIDIDVYVKVGAEFLLHALRCIGILF